MKNHSFCQSQAIYYLFSGFFALLALGSVAFASPLPLNDYLNQVRSTSPQFKASLALIEGTKEAALEKNLLTMPRFTFQGVHTVDQRQFTNSFLGGRTTSNNYNFGLEKQFNFGLNAKLSYGLLDNTTTALSPVFFPPSGANIFTQAQSQIELSQSLWRNFFGAETRATETQVEASSLFSHYTEKFKFKQLVAQAEVAYHNLAIAQELVRLEQDLFDHAKKILDWSTKRVQNHLADKIDMLQSKAAYQARELELQSSLDDVRTAKLAFNTLRNESDEAVNEEITLPSPESILSLSLPARADESDDLKAATQNEKLTYASNELAIQKTKPDLSLIGSAAFNGVDTFSSRAISRSFSTNHPRYDVGLKLTFPIYFWETSEIRSGRIKQQLAAENHSLQTKLENEQTWQDLSKKFNESKARLKLANELVSLQKEKLEYEKYRFNLGRTTTYQVLTFEQDYAQALILRLRIEQEILNTHSKLKTYAQD